MYAKDDQVIISVGELKELIADSMRLQALDWGGVDNWQWYGESFGDYLKTIQSDYVNNPISVKHEIFQQYIKDNDIEELYDLDFDDYAAMAVEEYPLA